MPEQPSLIMIQFLTWVADRPRNYAQTMDAWRSSCPRLSVWEDAIIEGLVRIEGDGNRTVRLTKHGMAVLVEAEVNIRIETDTEMPRANIRAKTSVVAHCAVF